MHHTIKIIKTEKEVAPKGETSASELVKDIVIYEQRIEGEFDITKVISVVNNLQKTPKPAAGK